MNSKLKTLEELREDFPEIGTLFSDRKIINGIGGALTDSEIRAFRQGFKSGNNSLWFLSRQEAIAWIKELDNDKGETFIRFSRRSCDDCITWIKHFFNITEKEIEGD